MKNSIKKILISLFIIMIGMSLIFPIGTYARAHTSSHSSGRSTTSVKSTTPSSTSKSTTSSSVKASTPKTTKSSTTEKTYSTTKSSAGRTTVSHETVKPKESTTIVNNNPTYYTNYSANSSYSLTNSIFQYYMLSEIFRDKESVSEQDIAKALEEKGYTEDEVKQILDEAKTEEKENKPFYDGWKWYNWTLLVVIIISILGLIIFGVIASGI